MVPLAFTKQYPFLLHSYQAAVATELRGPTWLSSKMEI